MILEEKREIDNLFKSAIEPYKMDPPEKVWSSIDAGLAINQPTGKWKMSSRLRFFSITVASLVVSFAAYHFLSSSLKNDLSVNENTSGQPALVTNEKTANAVVSRSKDIDEKVKAFFGKSAGNAASPATPTGDKKIEAVNQIVASDINNKPVTNNITRQEAKNVNPNAHSSVANTHTNHADNIISASIKSQSETASTGTAKNSVESSNSDEENTRNLNSLEVNSSNSNSTASTAQSSTQTLTSQSNSLAANNALNSSINSTESSGQTVSQPESRKAGTGLTQAENEAKDPKSLNIIEIKANPPITIAQNSSSKGAESVVEPANKEVASKDIAATDAATVEPLTLKQVKRRFSVDAFYSPQIAGRSMSSSTGITQNAGTTSSEKFNFSFNSGGMFRFDLNDRWSVSLGCTYSTLDYTTSVTTNYIVPAPPPPHDTTGGGGGGNGGGDGHDHDGHFPPQGDNDSSFSHQFQDTSYFHHYYSPSNNGFDYHNGCGSIHLQGNPSIQPPASSKPGDVVYFTTVARMHLEYINIPLTVSYKLTNRRFEYYASAGVSMNYLIKQQATVNIGDAYTETTNDISGLNKTSYNFLISAGVRYHFYKGLSVFVEPAYRRAITSITQDSSTGFYPYYLGLNTGVSFRF